MTLWVWFAFLGLIAVLVALDLGVFHRRARMVRLPEALAWTAFWVVLALAFNGVVYVLYERGMVAGSDPAGLALSGRQAALQFFTGYVLEKSLSLDNIFVIAMIFAYFRVAAEHQHRLLFWGVLGAVVLRGVMIAAGVALINRLEWVIYFFGVVLLVSAVRILVLRHDNLSPDQSWIVRMVRRAYPVSAAREDRLVVRLEDGRRAVTPLFLALLFIESSDVMFAVDSIPAIFAITRDPFLIFTSNVFAILGLRSLYFALAGLLHRFRHLKTSLAFVLAYIGIKMLLSHHYPIPNTVSLAIIAGILTVGLAASAAAGPQDPAALRSPLREHLEDLATVGLRQGRRIVVLVIGMTVLSIGVAMIVLPGPAFVFIPLGLAILGAEFAWARAWLRRLKRQTAELRVRVRRKVEGDRRDRRAR
jgi:tellurite resistance protein TerC